MSAERFDTLLAELRAPAGTTEFNIYSAALFGGCLVCLSSDGVFILDEKDTDCLRCALANPGATAFSEGE